MTTSRRVQNIFLDGIEQAIEMALTAYGRLAANAYRQESHREEPVLTTPMLLDAWSIVDSVNRLRVLIQSTRNLKHTTAVVALLKGTEDVLSLRNYVQHLDERAIDIASTAQPLLGSISWVCKLPSDPKNQFRVGGAVRLRRETLEVPMVNPAGKMFKPPIDLITLAADGIQVNLSHLVEVVALFNSRYEKATFQTQTNQNPDEDVAPIIVIDL